MSLVCVWVSGVSLGVSLGCLWCVSVVSLGVSLVCLGYVSGAVSGLSLGVSLGLSLVCARGRTHHARSVAPMETPGVKRTAADLSVGALSVLIC